MRFVRARGAACVWLALAAIGCHLPADADGSSLEAVAPETVRLLDVPFVPQSPALCGGAAVAMVMRFWEEPAVLAEDFADLLEPGGAGIRTDDLVNAVRARGWVAFPATGTPSDLQDHLARGRPIIVLLQVGSGSLHYVVVVGRGNGAVIVHDPAVAPFRTMREDSFDRAWASTGRWSLLILPPQPDAGPVAESPAAVDAGTVVEGCDAVVEEGIRRAHAGDAAGAEHQFVAARALCPVLAAPVRELAGTRPSRPPTPEPEPRPNRQGHVRHRHRRTRHPSRRPRRRPYRPRR